MPRANLVMKIACVDKAMACEVIARMRREVVPLPEPVAQEVAPPLE